MRSGGRSRIWHRRWRRPPGSQVGRRTRTRSLNSLHVFESSEPSKTATWQPRGIAQKRRVRTSDNLFGNSVGGLNDRPEHRSHCRSSCRPAPVLDLGSDPAYRAHWNSRGDKGISSPSWTATLPVHHDRPARQGTSPLADPACLGLHIVASSRLRPGDDIRWRERIYNACGFPLIGYPWVQSTVDFEGCLTKQRPV